ncbi:hypothetical protein [Pseudomonas oryzihabitans]|uniref:hypothetical protein n=1 Tax=Pseudomonas oryzihabitans TaxID=47885 RepID=UPI00128F986D|nr:hypothetical protein [Pseudomonas psychrotolerans]
MSFADYHHISPKVFDKTGALDPILGVDSRLFIDPSLLKDASTPELKDSYQHLLNHFLRLMKIIKSIESTGDRMWRQADSMLSFPEVSGLSIGYAKNVRGSGIGPVIRSRILSTVISIVRAGTDDPEIFELVGVFEDNIGPDRISDMTARVIIDDLIRYTQRVCNVCGIPMIRSFVKELKDYRDLPVNPIDNSILIMVPKEILRDLPVAMGFGDISWVAQHNSTLRDKLNSIIGDSWGKATKSEKKRKLREWFVTYPDLLKDIIIRYKNSLPEHYDFEEDKSGEVVWYRAAKESVAAAPLKLYLTSSPSVDEVYQVAKQICTAFQVMIEDNQLASLLYNKDGSRKHESAAQLLFFGVASVYCAANNLDLSPESDAGRGPVDFKFSNGAAGKVLVEIKLSSNRNLVKGYTKQLPAYMDAEGGLQGIYLIIDVGGGAKNVENLYNEAKQNPIPGLTIFSVDGSIRDSASTLR